MDGTPKVQRKASLSLSTRLNRKRHSASPQNRLITAASTSAIDSQELNINCDNLQRSPSVISICSDGGIECTPPHKKIALNLDETLDFSPKMFDRSYSPTCLLSQTLAIDSPEVGWKWSRRSANGADATCGNDYSSIRTPDSAYAADSSFASVGSSSTEVIGNIRQRSNSYRAASDARKLGQRKIIEQELRRVEITRAEEKLKQRCAKLEEQLKSAGTQRTQTISQPKKLSNAIVHSSSSNNVIVSQSTVSSTIETVRFRTPEKPKNPELLNDFFNDSDSDCFLLEATQEIESKIEANTQPAHIKFSGTAHQLPNFAESTFIPHASSAPAATTTPPSVDNESRDSKSPSTNSESKNKRSSFYMKFLEDDCPDDWFVSLDEVILQATQNKKPRTSLQRYKSMPTEAVGNSNVKLNKNDNNDDCFKDSKTKSSDKLLSFQEGNAASSSTLSKMKRHSSTHTLSPTGVHYRSRRQL